jgi:hypothetical protein
MNVSGLPSSTADLYMEFLTGNNNAGAVTSTSSDSSSSSTGVDTTYLDEAAQGTQLSTQGQQAAQEEFQAGLVTQLLNISV